MYKCKSDNQNTIFGSEKNEWYTNLESGALYSVPYQQMTFSNTDYFKTDNGTGVFNGNLGYIFNYDNNGNPSQTNTWPNNQNSTKFVVGAPFHFYFGLRKGKTSLNRYITKYIIGQ